jgi:phosphoribosyl 1,2-cyclic phosphodiesterase
MQLKVIGTGSSGNTYVFTERGKHLIIDAGMPLSNVKEYIDFKIENIVALFLTHEHGDHAKYAKDYVKRGIPTFASEITANTMDLKGYNVHHFKSGQILKLESFNLLPFSVFHNASDPHGFMILTKESGSTFFATDFFGMNHTFPKCDHILIEANFCETVLFEKSADMNIQVFKAALNHLSVQKAAEYANQYPRQNIILLHRSNSNSSENEQMLSHFNQKKIVRIAKKGDSFELNKYPF